MDIPVILVCIGALYVPLLIPLCVRRVLTINDLTAIHLPFRYLYASALRAGDSILWSSSFHSGLYLFAEGEAGMAHPLHLTLYRFLPLDVAFNLETITTYVAALLGMRLLLRRLNLSAQASWFGAMVFAFSGFNLLHLMHLNAVAVIAHTPWLLWATHLLVTSRDHRARAFAFGAFSLLLASALLVGHPQYVVISLVPVAFLALGLTMAGANRRRLAMVAGAAILGLCMGAIQWLPTLDAIGSSVRSAPSMAFRTSYSLSPLNLIQLWSPYAFATRAYTLPGEGAVHEFSVYNGAFCSVALAWIVARWGSMGHRWLTIGCLGLAAFGLLMALGRFGGVYPFVSALPGVSTFRAPARFLVLFQLSLSALAAIVFDDLAALARGDGRIAIPRLWPLAALVGVSVATTAGAAIAATSPVAADHGFLLSGLRLAAPWCIALIITTLLMVMAARGARWALPLLAVVTAADLGIWGYSYLYEGGGLRTIAELVTVAPVPPGARAAELYEPTATGNGPAENLGVLRDLRISIGYMGIKPSSVLLGDELAMRVAGVTWHNTGGSWTRIPDPMPRVRLVSAVTRADDSKAIRVALTRIDIARAAVVSGPVQNLEGAPGSARIIGDRPGHMVVDTTADGGQLLVTTERFHAGWRAYEDDHLLETVRVNGDFLGCRVDAGTHRIDLTFDPPSLVQGIRLAAVGFALTVVAVGLLWIPRQPA